MFILKNYSKTHDGKIVVNPLDLSSRGPPSDGSFSVVDPLARHDPGQTPQAEEHRAVASHRQQDAEPQPNIWSRWRASVNMDQYQQAGGSIARRHSRPDEPAVAHGDELSDTISWSLMDGEEGTSGQTPLPPLDLSQTEED